MSCEDVKDIIEITNIDKDKLSDDLKDCKVDVPNEIVNNLILLAKSITGNNGEEFSFKLPEGVSGALSKVLVTSLEMATPLAGIVSLISVAAWKYFFCINSQLEDINTKLSNIIDFLETDKLCELESQFRFLEFTYNNYENIVTNEAERLATIVQTQATRKVALQNILFYERFLSRHLLKTSNVKNNLMNEAKTFLENAQNYRYSAELYCVSLIMELVFSQNYNNITNVKNEISDTIKMVDKKLNETVGAMKKALNSNKSIKKSDPTVSQIMEFDPDSIIGKREQEYNGMLDELSKKINTNTRLIIKDNSLYIK